MNSEELSALARELGLITNDKPPIEVVRRRLREAVIEWER